MRSLYIITAFLFGFALSIIAQSNIESIVEGSVVEASTGNPMQQATVRILSLPDSLLVKGAVSSSDGKFSISIKQQGSFIVSVSFIGFGTYYRNVKLSASTRRFSLGKIELKEDALLLKEAVVEGKAPEIVLKEDTVEYNADSYKLPPSSLVEDLIKKLPGVEIDENGNIVAGGKTITRILVDGKEFFGKDVNVALKNINVNILEKLQVIDRKSEEARLTGVDDGDDEKVINLTVKKGMKNGWFGNAMGGYGNNNRFEAASMVNRFVEEQQYSMIMGMNNTNNAGYADLGPGMNISSSSSRGINQAGNVGTNFNVGKNDQFRLGGSVMFSGNNQSIGRISEREYIQSLSSYNQDYHAFNKSRVFDTNFKLQWRVDSLTKMMVEPTFKYTKNNNSSHSNYNTRNKDNYYVNQGDNRRSSDIDGYSYSLRTTIARSSKIKKGRRFGLSLSLSAFNNDGTSLQHANTIYGDPENPKSTVRDTTIQQKQHDNNDKWGLWTRLTYVEPFGKNRFLQAAYSFSRNQTNSDRLTYNWLDDESNFSTEFDSLYSDRFKNTFITQTFSLNIRTVRKKYNYSLGAEVVPSYTHSVNCFDGERSFNRSVVNYGPTGEFVYLWNKHHNLRFRYRGKTQQPSISQLQPSKNITNPLNIRVGNLELNPCYQNNFSLRYNNYNPKKQRSVQANLEGRIDMNSIVNKITYDSNSGTQTTMPVNVDGVWNIKGMVMVNTPLFGKHLQFSNTTHFGFNQQVGFTNMQRNVSKTLNGREILGLRYNSKWLDVGLKGNYSYSDSKNTIASNRDQNVMNFGGTANLVFYLPLNIRIASDLSYLGNHGYSSAMSRSEWQWNVQAYLEFLKKKQATAFFRAYDLLKQRSTLWRNVTANYVEDIQSEMLTNYFIAGLIVRFNTMGTNATHRRNHSNNKVNRNQEKY